MGWRILERQKDPILCHSELSREEEHEERNVWPGGPYHAISGGRKDSFESLVGYTLTENLAAFFPYLEKGVRLNSNMMDKLG